MRAWIQNSLLGRPSPSRTLPSQSRRSRVSSLANMGAARAGIKKVSVPGTQPETCPNAVTRPSRWAIRLARATSSRSTSTAAANIGQSDQPGQSRVPTKPPWWGGTPEVSQTLLQEARRSKPRGLPDQVRLASLQGTATDGRRQEVTGRLGKGAPHEDLRDWLEMVDAIGELRVLEGVDTEENIGRISEM